MKKFLVVLVLAAVIATGTVFADHPGGLGFGVQGGGGGTWSGGGFGVNRGAALSLKIPSMPIFWAIDIEGNSLGVYLGIAGDYYFVDSALVPGIGLNWYFGFGVGAGIGIYNDIYFSIVARLPVGLSWQLDINAGPIDAFEIYLQAVPSLGISLNPFKFPAGGWPINVGFRLWF